MMRGENVDWQIVATSGQDAFSIDHPAAFDAVLRHCPGTLHKLSAGSLTINTSLL
jgi:hypothetical protein